MKRTRLTSLFVFVLIVVLALGYTFASGNKPLLGLDLQGGVSVVLQPKGNPQADAVEQAKRIIRSRVDALGVAEPDIVRQGRTIVVQLPGVKDRQKALTVIGQTAKLEFRPVLQTLSSAPSSSTPPGAPTTNITPGSSATPGAPDSSGIAPTVAPSTSSVAPSSTPQVVGPSTTAASSGANDGTSTQQSLGGPADGENAASFQDPTTAPTAPTTAAPAPAPSAPAPPAAGVPGATGTPGGSAPACSSSSDPTKPCVGTSRQKGQGKLLLGPVQAPGAAVGSAQAAVDQQTGGGNWLVNISIKSSLKAKINALFNDCYAGGRTCPATGSDTKTNQPRGRAAIVLDGVVQSAPTVDGQNLADSSFQISGGFTKKDASDLALVLRYGALPVEFKKDVNVQEVSATLGKDYLHAGLVAGFVGLSLVALYMIGFYRLLGVVAIFSLGTGAALLWTVISYLGETRGLALTLAGITGIIVSIGVAVDSNVVFYEHLREDMSKGRSLRSTVNGSFDSAWRTIVSADLVSLIGAGLLYWLTVGSVRGFAFYLGLSTILDLVASYLFMRPLVLWMGRKDWFQDRPRLLGVRGRPAFATGADAVAVASTDADAGAGNAVRPRPSKSAKGRKGVGVR